jgi:hypothetical protein
VTGWRRQMSGRAAAGVGSGGGGRSSARAAPMRSSDLCSLNFWLDLAVTRSPTPFLGQYPGRSGVSRPSSEWHRVGPPRCDHQVEPEVQRSDVGDQMAPEMAKTSAPLSWLLES